MWLRGSCVSLDAHAIAGRSWLLTPARTPPTPTLLLVYLGETPGPRHPSFHLGGTERAPTKGPPSSGVMRIGKVF